MMPSIAFLHPDLGIGGAERLIVDCALALKSCHHSIVIFTSHHDQNHCFEETKNGTIHVVTAGDWLPRSTLGKFKAFWANIRMFYLTLFFVFQYSKFDFVICDQISSGIPILKMFRRKCIFYCHFPDQLLTKRETLFKKIYRLPIDFFEEWTTGLADVILVNSYFTEEVFRKTFKSLSSVPISVLYPTFNSKSLDKKMTGSLDLKLTNVDFLFLSINRYERKKNIEIAIEALKKIQEEIASFKKKTPIVHLIIAGGYDLKNDENIEYFDELKYLTEKLQVNKQVTFLKNFSSEQKQVLLHNCTAIIYTPENEHFGIVPLEAMYMTRPVIAHNSGGPRETIIDGETGFLCENNFYSFANAMMKFIQDKSLSKEMGSKGHEHVVKNFNFIKFTNQLNKLVTSLS